MMVIKKEEHRNVVLMGGQFRIRSSEQKPEIWIVRPGSGSQKLLTCLVLAFLLSSIFGKRASGSQARAIHILRRSCQPIVRRCTRLDGSSTAGSPSRAKNAATP
jgi:hypothetical protein